MNKLKEYFNKKYSYLIVIGCTLLVMAIVFMVLGIYPFGVKTVLTIDSNGQYIQFMSYLRDSIINLDFPFYSFNSLLGSSSIGIICYYLLSPFNFLLIFFNNETMFIGFLLIYVLKILSLSVTTLYMFRYLKRSNFTSILFTLLFTFSGFCIAYASNIMWFDVLIVTPLIIVGIEKIFKENKCTLFLVSLLYAIITNYYIAYMVCIFAVIYFIYKIVITDKESYNLKNASIKFISGGIGAALLSAIISIPSLITLVESKFTTDTNVIRFGFNFNIFEFFSKFFTGSLNELELKALGLPNIYITIVGLLFVCIFFGLKQISKREKAISLSIIFIFFISFYITQIDIAWHVFSKPVWFNHRYSFLFILFLLIIGSKALDIVLTQSIEERKIIIKPISIMSGILGIGLIYCVFKNYHHITLYGALIDTVIVIALVCILLRVDKKYINLKYLNEKVVISTCILLSLIINFFISWSDFDLPTIATYKGNINEIQNNINELDKRNDSFFRVGETTNRSLNDGYQFGYYGVNHSSSTPTKYNRYLFDKMGFYFSYNDHNFMEGSTLFANSYINVKYMQTRLDKFSYYDKVNLKSNNILNYFENDYSLPLVYASNLIPYENLQFKSRFDIMQHVAELATGDDYGSMYTYADYSFDTYNCVIKNGVITPNGESDELAYIEFEVKVNKDGPLYIENLVYATGKEGYLYRVIKDNETVIPSDYVIQNIGDYKKGDTVKVRYIIDGTFMKLEQINFATEDLDVTKKYLNELRNGYSQFEIDSNTSAWGAVTVPENKEGFTISVVNSDEWTIKVDGKEVKQKPNYTGFMYIEAEPGVHSIEMSFTPKGLKLGASVSSVALLSIIGYNIFIKKKRKQHN